MKKLLSKATSNPLAQDLKSHLSPSTAATSSHGPAPSIPPPTPSDLHRYGAHHGTNLGSLFVLERWLTPSLFPPSCSGSSELDAVTAHLAQSGLAATRRMFEQHWRGFVSDADLDWLVEVGCTAVRLPIGHWTLGREFCEGTAFEGVGEVYVGAWDCVRDLVERCRGRGIGVLVDLHGLPGGANGQDHSGTCSGKAELWGTRRYEDLAVRCGRFVVEELRGLENVVGIQVCNEAEWSSQENGRLWRFYDRVLDAVAGVDSTLPVYISDAWNLGGALKEAAKRNQMSRGGNPVVVDTHLYWCFSDADKNKSPQAIISEVAGKLGELEGVDGSVVDRGAAQVIVGEYSCVLAEDTWAKTENETRQQLVRSFGQAQSQHYQTRAGGSYFWTYKMDWMDGGEWGIKSQTKQGAITAPPHSRLDVNQVREAFGRAQAQKEQRVRETYNQHQRYWDTNYPGQYEHHRFEAGWKIGFEDAAAIFQLRSSMGQRGASKIGMLDLWILKRVRESGQAGKFVWEYEQGLRQGIRDFYELADV